MQIQEDLKQLRRSAVDVIRNFAQANGGIEYSRGYADGDWSINVSASGNVSFGGYAAESYQATDRLEDLDFVDLGGILGQLNNESGKY